MVADAHVRELAESLVGSPVEAVRVVGGGGNSRLYRVESGAGVFALKRYPSSRTDPRDRLGHEFGGFAFLAAHGVGDVPRALARDVERGCALYEWIDGGPVQPNDAAVDAMLALLERLHALRHAEGAQALPPAAESVIRPGDLSAQIDGRIERLIAAGDAEPELRAFLLDDVQPEWERRRADEAGPALARAHQTLSPSDFGTHNMLSRPAGGMAFVDFEYFGWDDPVKLVCDVLWHPAMNLTPDLGSRFASGAAALYAADPGYADRFAIGLPLYGLRWALIVLNEFLPDRWEQRRLAGDPASWAAAKTRQLAKAKALVARVRAL